MSETATADKKTEPKKPNTFGMTKEQKREAEIVAQARAQRKDAPNVEVGKSRVCERKKLAQHFVPESKPVMGKKLITVDGKTHEREGVIAEGEWHTFFSSDDPAAGRQLLLKGYERVYDCGQQVSHNGDLLWKIPTELTQKTRAGFQNESRARVTEASAVSIESNVEETTELEGATL